MTEPAAHEPDYDDSLEENVEEILAAARPLPSGGEMIIEELTEDEEHRFFEAIRST